MLLDKLKKIVLFILVITIPLARIFNLNSYAIALFTILFLFSPRKKFIPPLKPITFLFCAYFIVLSLNVLVVAQPHAASILLKYIPLVLIPISLLFVNYQKEVLEVFVYSIVFSSLTCIVHATIKSKGYIFYYHNPTELLDIQINYLGIFICFALAILYHEILAANVAKLKHYLFIPILFFSLAVLFNRTAIIASLIITLFFVVSLFKRYRNTKFLIGFIIFFASTTTWILSRPIIQSKFEELVHLDYKSVSNYNNGVSSRLLSWECSWDYITNGGFFGHGTNNTKALLKVCYEQKIGADTIQVSKGYNAHNQFLQTALGHGYLGLMVLLAIYGHILFVCIRQRDFLLLLYFVIILIFGMTESFMVRQWGIAFFTFFTPFLLSRWDPQKKQASL
ncbi:O-antigen ligase family protein [Maribacter sp. 2304DJ31-5]|uniref:O-antigen ligase family protein n=1 Tax=Maribacter sp. 2304DJ31-5 TaxID=3386273 RepID=UPI0039BD8E5A